MNSGIYKITCLVNKKVYIGSAKWTKKRISKHKWCLQKKCHTNRHLQNAFNLYGSDQFVFEAIEFCHETLLLEREQFWIDFHQAADRNFGFNVVPYSDRKQMSAETKKKISASMKGRKKSKQTRLAMKKAQQNRSQEWNDKIAAGQTGKKKSEDAKRNMSLARKKLFEDGYVSHRTGAHVSAETRQKLSDRLKERYNSGMKISKTRKVICVETGQKFDTIALAAKHFGLSAGSITRSCRTHYRSGGFRFEYGD